MKTNTKRVASFEKACEKTGRKRMRLAFWLLRLVLKSKADRLYAYYKMSVISEALNENWKADWSDSCQTKHIPWFDTSSGFVFGGTFYCYSRPYAGLSSRLCFPDIPTAKYAGKHFVDIWNVILC